MPPSSLVIKGIPLDLVHRVNELEVASAPFNSAMQAFNNARGAGTPLRPVTDQKADPGPAPYLRNAITEMVVRYADGGPPDPVGESELSAVAEAHLALIQVVADRAATISAGTSADPYLPTIAEIDKFGIVQADRPEWLDHAYLQSLVRVHTAEPSATNTAPLPAENPVYRLSAESAFWRTIPAHGGRERAAAEGKADALASVLPSSYLDIDPQPTQDTVVKNDDENWMHIAVEQFAGAVQGMAATPPVPAETGLKARLLSRFAEGAKPPEPVIGQNGAVVMPENVLEIISNLDMMRGYVFQPV